MKFIVLLVVLLVLLALVAKVVRGPASRVSGRDERALPSGREADTPSPRPNDDPRV